MVGKILLFVLTLTVLAQSQDAKTKKIACEPTLVYGCTEDKCVKIEVVNVDGVQYFEIDPEKKTLEGIIGEARVDIEHIVSRHGNEKTFIFFGTHADSKFDWVLRIDKKTKKMVLLATNEELDGFTVYGTCKWEEGK